MNIKVEDGSENNPKSLPLPLKTQIFQQTEYKHGQNEIYPLLYYFIHLYAHTAIEYNTF